jgi:hypothetical protein
LIVVFGLPTNWAPASDICIFLLFQLLTGEREPVGKLVSFRKKLLWISLPRSQGIAGFSTREYVRRQASSELRGAEGIC